MIGIAATRSTISLYIGNAYHFGTSMPTLHSAGAARATARSGAKGSASDFERSYTVGTVPPSMTYSVPVIEPARGETRNPTRSATSRGFAGRPIGMPPSDAINAF
jgi:hypothetical protein